MLLDLRPDDLRAAVESATHQHDALAKRRGVTVELDLPSRPIRIRHDPPRIGQVVANLVGNAVKFTPRGGAVRVSVEPTPDGARIDVADTGVGIDPNELPHIFERFYRGSRANEARGAGSGLGLAIVRSIVDIHGGTVDRRERAGHREPVHRPAAAGPAERRRHAGSGTGRRRDRRRRHAPDAPRPVRRRISDRSSDASQEDERIVTETSPSDAPHVNPASAP